MNDVEVVSGGEFGSSENITFLSVGALQEGNHNGFLLCCALLGSGAESSTKFLIVSIYGPSSPMEAP